MNVSTTGNFRRNWNMKKSENNNNNKKKNMSEKFTFISKGAKNLLYFKGIGLALFPRHLSFDKKNTFYTYTFMHVKKLGISSINIPFVVFYSHINLRNKQGKFTN